MEGFVLVFVLFAIAIPLAIWVVIENETSNATVVDRAEAERIAKERGGRGGSRSDEVSNSDPNSTDSDRDRDYAIADRIHDPDDDRDEFPRGDPSRDARNRDDRR